MISTHVTTGHHRYESACARFYVVRMSRAENRGSRVLVTSGLVNFPRQMAEDKRLRHVEKIIGTVT